MTVIDLASAVAISFRMHAPLHGRECDITTNCVCHYCVGQMTLFSQL